MERRVTTQTELDAALADKAALIYINSPHGVWLQLNNTGSSHVVAWESSHVVARESSHVEARESSHVVARESSHVVAWGSSHVVAWESSHVVARESSHVEAWGSSHVVAWGSSHVVAWESSHVVAWGSSHVEAGSHVAVHLHSARAEISGGVLIDLTDLDLTDPQAWCDYHGVKVADGIATVYKAVDEKYEAGHNYTLTSYAPGSTPRAHDWHADGECGGGLHFGPTPAHATVYNDAAKRWLAVGVRLEEMSVIADGGTAKVKAARVTVPCVEVDRYGKPVERVEAAS